jgi:hypothetical protein
MDERQRDRLVVAVKRCIEEKFSGSEWDELGYLTGSKDAITDHHRLLRSLHFMDDDYGSNVFSVIDEIIKRDPANLQIISDYIKLPEWLRENQPQEYEDLYGHMQPLLASAEALAITSSFQLNQQIARIRRALESDPELAVGSAKEMLESVLKTVLSGFGEIDLEDDIPVLLKRAQKRLKLDPRELAPDAKGAEVIKRLLSNLGQVVLGINELRGLYGTGHGKVKSTGITPRHARLVVGAAATLASFLMETYELRSSGGAV